MDLLEILDYGRNEGDDKMEDLVMNDFLSIPLDYLLTTMESYGPTIQHICILLQSS